MTLGVQVGTPGREEESDFQKEEPVPLDSHLILKSVLLKVASAPPERQQAVLDPL